jgi:hypothetical protein
MAKKKTAIKSKVKTEPAAVKPEEKTHKIQGSLKAKKPVVEKTSLPKGSFLLNRTHSINGVAFGPGVLKVGDTIGPYEITKGLMNSLLSRDAGA